MALSRFAPITVLSAAAPTTQASFSDVLLIAQCTSAQQSSQVRLYTSAAEMTSLPAQLQAFGTTFFAQNPNPGRLLVGRRTPGTAQVVTITVSATGNGVWSFVLEGVTISYTAAGSPTTQVIAEGLAAAAAATAKANGILISTVTGGVFTLSALTPGVPYVVSSFTPGGSGTGSATTTTANVAAQSITAALDAAEQAGLPFFGLVTENLSDADALLAAAWASSRQVHLFMQSSALTIPAGTAGNLALQLKALNYGNVTHFWTRDSAQRMAVAQAARYFAANLDQNATTLAFQSLVGISADAGETATTPLTSAEIATIESSGSNTYTYEGGRNVTFPGKAVSGEYTDIHVSQSFLSRRCQEAIFAILSGTPTKVPYDLSGATSLEAALRSVAETGVRAKHINPGYVVFVPDPATLTSAQRATRSVPGITLSAVYTGAIHQAPVTLQLTK